MEYKFYGWEQANVRAVTDEYGGILTPRDLYDALSGIWCERTCAPRLRDGWSKENRIFLVERFMGFVRKAGISIVTMW